MNIVSNKKIHYYSYRIEEAILVNMLKNVNIKNEIIMYKELIHAIEIHRRAIKLVFI